VPQRQGRRHDIQHPPHVQLVYAAVYDNAQHRQKKTAIKNQAALVNPEYFHQIVPVGTPPELDDVGYPRPDDTGNNSDEHQRCRLILAHLSNFTIVADNKNRRYKTQCGHHSVPAYGQLSDF